MQGLDFVYCPYKNLRVSEEENLFNEVIEKKINLFLIIPFQHFLTRIPQKVVFLHLLSNHQFFVSSQTVIINIWFAHHNSFVAHSLVQHVDHEHLWKRDKHVDSLSFPTTFIFFGIFRWWLISTPLMLLFGMFEIDI